MRFIIFLLLASPAAAWEFAPSPICTLRHTEGSVDVVLTYDQSLPEYTLTVTRADPWPDAGLFDMTFAGPRSFTITTDRHALSDDRKSLTVKDSGFGNVLDGLQFFTSVTAMSGREGVALSLRDAASAVAAFRECPAAATS